MSEANTSKDHAEFQNLKLHNFISRGFGFLLKAPRSWQDRSNDKLFQVVDPQTNTQFTASGYQNPGITLEKWAEARLAVVNQAMPYLHQLKAPYTFNGASWTGIAAEYGGVFPDTEEESHYLVLCLMTEKSVISFTITAQTEAFVENEALYRWLLETQLDFVEVVYV